MGLKSKIYSRVDEMNVPSELMNWVDECAELCNPDEIVFIDGSDEEKTELEKRAVETGELIKLNEEKLPGSYYHRSDPNDVARVEELTFICTKNKEDAGPNNNWISPKDAYEKAARIFRNSMKGRTMYVIPFSMGPIGSPFSKIGIQITDSIYVVLNMRIMTRVGNPVIEWLRKKGEFTKCLHSKADLAIKNRLILHMPEDNTIWSVGSGYGGNALLGKKCLALRIASYLANKEGWFAEHMLITGIEDPDGNVHYIAAAFPSACGKTNLAMLMPPDEYRKKGYKVWTVGDDIAWMRIGKDGRLWAINPEAGFFGVVPGTNSKTNPNMMKTISRNTIYTNVALKPDGTIWWEGADGEPPEKATDWRGREWHPDKKDENGNKVKAAHPNSRFTAPAAQCPIISKDWERHEGVPISAIIFGARRASVVPLVFESFNWRHGVYLGATMASERTAAQAGEVGELRRDPMAMLPFCGYNMADYFRHWIDMGKKIPNPPKIFHVNWFRKDESGKFIWPGFGENFRVIMWILRRCNGAERARKTPIGYIPEPESINCGLPPDRINLILDVDKEAWKSELPGHKQFFEKFGSRLPQELWEEYRDLEKRLSE